MFVYIFKDQFNRVKIGVSIQPKRRFKDICQPAALEVKEYFISEDRDDALYIEQRVLKHFEPYKISGEWVSTPYDTVLEYMAETLDVNSNSCASEIRKLGYEILAKKIELSCHNTHSYLESHTTEWFNTGILDPNIYPGIALLQGYDDEYELLEEIGNLILLHRIGNSGLKRVDYLEHYLKTGVWL